MKRILFLSLVCSLFLLSNMSFSSWTCKSKPNPDTPVVPKVTYSGMVFEDGGGYAKPLKLDGSWEINLIEQATGQSVQVTKGAYYSFTMQVEKGKARAFYVSGVQRGTGLNGSKILHSLRSAVYYLTQDEIQNGATALNLLVTIK